MKRGQGNGQMKTASLPEYTVNGMKILPRTVACRSNDPFMSLDQQPLGASECGRQT